MYRKILAATSALIAPAIATAADLPVRTAAPAPVFAAAPITWTGFYFGLHAGAGHSNTDVVLSALDFGQDVVALIPDSLAAADAEVLIPARSPWSSHGQSGALAGAQIGYNWQVSPSVVIGAELDWSWTGIDGTAACGFASQFACNTQTNWIATLSGRAGFVAGAAMIYAKAGLAYADTDYASYLPGVYDAFRLSDERFGYLIGAGVEYKISPNWSAKIEYNYVDLGRETYRLSEFASITCVDSCGTVSVDQDFHLVKFGVNYHFASAPGAVFAP